MRQKLNKDIKWWATWESGPYYALRASYFAEVYPPPAAPKATRASKDISKGKKLKAEGGSVGSGQWRVDSRESEERDGRVRGDFAGW